MRKVKGFSYDPVKDQDVMSFLSKQTNQSQYMWDLVRKDMSNNDLESIIKKHIEIYLSKIDLSQSSYSSIEIDEDSVIDILKIT